MLGEKKHCMRALCHYCRVAFLRKSIGALHGDLKLSDGVSPVSQSSHEIQLTIRNFN